MKINRPLPKIRLITAGVDNKKLLLDLDPNDWAHPEIVANQINYEVSRAKALDEFWDKPLNDNLKYAIQFKFQELWYRLIERDIMYETSTGWKIDHYIQTPQHRTDTDYRYDLDFCCVAHHG